jgi:hypothetical protein
MSTLKVPVLRIITLRALKNSFLLLLIASPGLQCRRQEPISRSSIPRPNQGVLTGKLVVSDACGMSAIEVLSGAIDPSKVSASWTDPDDHNTYVQVFKVSGSDMYCNLAAYGLGKGDTLQFELDPNPPNMTCMSCNDVNPPSVPPIYNAIRNVRKLNVTPTAP